MYAFAKYFVHIIIGNVCIENIKCRINYACHFFSKPRVITTLKVYSFFEVVGRACTSGEDECAFKQHKKTKDQIKTVYGIVYQRLPTLFPR